MRISDWISDVCSADLVTAAHRPILALNRSGGVGAIEDLVELDQVGGGDHTYELVARANGEPVGAGVVHGPDGVGEEPVGRGDEIGRASGWERVCQNV